MRLAGLALLCCIPAGGFGAAEVERAFPPEPLPRVEIGGHAGDLKTLAVSPDDRLLLTVSDDHTARIWSAGSGRLERVLRLPQDNALDGQIYVGAFSPDGNWVVVGGYLRTAAKDDTPFVLYAFHTSTWSLSEARRIEGFRTAVTQLAFSRDGRQLAVAQGGGAGLLIVDWQAFAATTSRLVAPVYHADEPGDEILGLDFSPSNQLLVTTRRGWLKLYDPRSQFRDTVRVAQTADIALPMRPRFAPDGTRFVVGSETSAQIAVFDSATLQMRATLRSAEPMRGIYTVAWSADGNFIYAGGETTLGGPGVLLRFALAEANRVEVVLRSERLMRDLRLLHSGALAFASGEPEVGVLEPTLRMRWRKRSSIVSIRSDAQTLRASADGSVIQLRPAPGSARWIRFSINSAAAQMLSLRDSESADLFPAVRAAPGWTIQIGPNNESMQVNSLQVALDRFERVRSYAFAADGADIVIGTSWALRRVDRAGQSRWTIRLAAETDSVLVTRNQRWIVAALSDGTVRWYRYADGKEQLALLALRNGMDWVAWIPPGYYVSSPAGDTLFGWHFNRSDPTIANGLPSGEFFRASQFERILYRPDLVAAYFARAGEPATEAVAASVGAFDVARLDSIAPPRVQISSPALRAQDSGMRRVRIRAQPRALRMEDWNLFVNGIPAIAYQQRMSILKGAAAGGFETELSLALTQPLNTIRVEASNGQALGIDELVIEAPAGSAPRAGNLYIVAIGAGRFADSRIKPLRYAWRDAIEFAKLLQTSDRDHFADSRTLVLADDSSKAPTRENITRDLEPFLAQAGANDTVLVFLASHGLSDPRGNYYFVPADGRFEDIQNVKNGAGAAASLLPWQFFFDALSRTAGRRVLVVDTCSSGAMGGTFDAFSLAKRSMSSSFALVAASSGSEESQESESKQHGLFTFGLIDAIRTGFDPNGDGSTSLAEAFEHAFDTVQSLRNRGVGTQTPQLSGPTVLLDTPLAWGAVTAGRPQI